MRETGNRYLSLRQEYTPKHIKLVIIAESPPASGKYFYDPEGECSEALFKAMMEFHNLSPRTKDEGLRAFQQLGWVLVDATYTPVNRLPNPDQVIVDDYPKLLHDLDELTPDRSVPLVLIKANVCSLLEPRLRQGGFRVLNNIRKVYFPACGWQNVFQEQLRVILGRHNLGA